MGVFHVSQIVHMVPNLAVSHANPFRKPDQEKRAIPLAHTHTRLFPLRGLMIVHLNFTQCSLRCTIVASLFSTNNSEAVVRGGAL